MSSTAQTNIKEKTSTRGSTDVVVAFFNFIVQLGSEKDLVVVSLRVHR